MQRNVFGKSPTGALRDRLLGSLKALNPGVQSEQVSQAQKRHTGKAMDRQGAEGLKSEAGTAMWTQDDTGKHKITPPMPVKTACMLASISLNLKAVLYPRGSLPKAAGAPFHTVIYLRAYQFETSDTGGCDAAGPQALFVLIYPELKVPAYQRLF